MLHSGFLYCRARVSLWGSSCCQAWAPGHTGSVLVAHRLSCPWQVGSSRTTDQTHVPYIARQTLNHWTTREALDNSLSKPKPFSVKDQIVTISGFEDYTVSVTIPQLLPLHLKSCYRQDANEYASVPRKLDLQKQLLGPRTILWPKNLNSSLVLGDYNG